MDKKLFARIVPGSIAEFDLVLKGVNGFPFNLAAYSVGKLVFRNTAGIRTEVPLTLPGPNPGAGIIRASLTSLQTLNADGAWASGDLELTSPAGLIILPLTNRFEIVKRNIPAG